MFEAVGFWFFCFFFFSSKENTWKRTSRQSVKTRHPAPSLASDLDVVRPLKIFICRHNEFIKSGLSGVGVFCVRSLRYLPCLFLLLKKSPRYPGRYDQLTPPDATTNDKIIPKPPDETEFIRRPVRGRERDDERTALCVSIHIFVAVSR